MLAKLKEALKPKITLSKKPSKPLAADNPIDHMEQFLPNTGKKSPGKWEYSPIIKREAQLVKEEEFKEAEYIIDEKVVAQKPKLESVKDLSDLTFWQNISLVTYFNNKESGRLDDLLMREEYFRNSESLRRVNTLKFFLLESARRNLEYGEYDSIRMRIDPRFRNEFYECLSSKLLSSYKIIIEREHEILTQLEVDPIIISMRLNV